MVGNHGMHHRKWATLDNRELQEEVIEAKDRLEQIVGSEIVEAACPFGSYDRRVLRCRRRMAIKRFIPVMAAQQTPALGFSRETPSCATTT